MKKCFKIFFVGDTCIGAKTSLIREILLRGNELKNIDDLDFCRGVHKKITLNNGEEITLILTDTAGQERFQSIVFNHMKNKDCIVLGFDLTRKSTFESAKGSWISEIKEYKCLKYLIGNKF